MEISMLYHASADSKKSTDELVARAQAGDREAFGLIFEQQHRFIYKFIYAMLGEHALAEELTQETFFGAYKNIASLRGDAKLPTWLCGIAKNVVYKSFRTNRKAGTPSEETVDTGRIFDEKNVAPDRQFLNKELNQVIAAALGKLSADRRLIFILKEIQHLSYGEIAEITGCSIPKLKTDLHRAKLEMRGLLRPYLEVKNEL